MYVELEEDIPVRGRKKRTKKDGKTQRVIKEKFLDERETFLKPVTAKTEKQKKYFKALNDPDVHVVVALGFHGSGKSYVSAVTAADKFRKGEINKIIVARPYVQTGRTSGYKPGSSLDKLYPYVRNILDTVKERIGGAAYEIALKDGLTGQIEVQELESIRGRSFDEPSFLIIDEAQQALPEEMKSIVTRISDKCKLVLAGDIRQKDIHGQSGMEWFIDFVKRHKISGVEIIDFCDPEDIVRGGFVRDIAVGLMKDSENGLRQ